MLISTIVSTLFASTASAAALLGHQRDAQVILQSSSDRPAVATGRKLHGRFLHITDIHTDPFYVAGSDPDRRCHRGHGDPSAGHWGAEMSSCDSPWTLVNETFRWIDENVKDKIDFVVWTGDSARHDNDVNIPRTSTQIYDINRQVVEKMREVFGRPTDDPEGPFTVPIVPTLGNNDIFPHNIMISGPSDVTRKYETIWNDFVPYSQYHVFRKGAYFWKQVVPGKNGVSGPGSIGGLAVFSLNTLYFFDSNKAVDGCDTVGEPGYEQFEWLAIQLELMRKRGTKVILMGHVPPTWTSAKRSWDRSCWKKYVRWSRQYRDIITGHLYGHMNIDHFFVSDTHKLKKKDGKNNKKKKHNKGKRRSISPANMLLKPLENVCLTTEFDPEDDPKFSVYSAETYLQSLRDEFEKVPELKDKSKSAVRKYRKSIGGKWGERYIVTNVSPSVVPDYFPTLRIMEYNITGLVDGNGYQIVKSSTELEIEEAKKDKKKKSKKPKNPKAPKKTKPDGPDKTAPPGPAYSVQPFTFLSYVQYFANLTTLNSEYKKHEKDKKHAKLSELRRDLDETKKEPRVRFEVEYDTRTDKVYKLKDLTVRSYLKLARKIVDATKTKETKELNTRESDEDLDEQMKHGKKRHRKHKNRDRKRDRIWHEFVKRAFVGTVDGEELQEYEAVDCDGSI